MFCSSCGKELTEGAKFCANCGAAVPESEPVAPVYEEPVEETEITVAEEAPEEPVSVPVQEQPPVYTTPSYSAPAPAPAQQSGGKGLGIAAVICGAIALLLAATCCGTVISIPLGLTGFIMGIIAARRPASKTLGVVGLILGAASVLLSIIILVLAIGSAAEFDTSIYDEFYSAFDNEFYGGDFY